MKKQDKPTLGTTSQYLMEHHPVIFRKLGRGIRLTNKELETYRKIIFNVATTGNTK